MPKLTFSAVRVDGSKEEATIADLHDIDLIVFLLENGSLHFLPELLSNQIRFVNDLVVNKNAASVFFHSRQVRTMFDALSLGMSDPLRELRYNIDTARSQLTEEELNRNHNLHYTAQMKALYLQALILPVVIVAADSASPLEVRYEV